MGMTISNILWNIKAFISQPIIPTVSMKYIIEHDGTYSSNNMLKDRYVYYWIGDFKTGKQVKVKSIDVLRHDFISGLMMDEIYEKGLADGSVACVERTTFESTTYKSVEPHSCETYDDGEGWRCSKCCNVWKKAYVDPRWEHCPKCGSQIISWKENENG